MSPPHPSAAASFRLSWWIGCLGGGLVVIAVIHAFNTHSAGQMVASAWPAGAVSFIFVASTVFQRFDDITARMHMGVALRLGFLRLLLSLVLSFLAGIAWSAVLFSAYDVVMWPRDHLLPGWARLRMPSWVLLALAVCPVFFVLRRVLRSTYGFLEAVTGVFVVCVKSTTADPHLALTILTAGIYLTVRGFDNIHQGMKDHDEAVKSATAAATLPDKRVDPLARNLCRTRDAKNGRFETRLINLLFWK